MKTLLTALLSIAIGYCVASAIFKTKRSKKSNVLTTSKVWTLTSHNENTFRYVKGDSVKYIILTSDSTAETIKFK